MSSLRSFILSLVFGLGLLFVFIGERLIATGSMRGTLTGTGVAFVIAVFVLRLLRMSKMREDAARIERWLTLFTGIGLLALCLYFLQSDLYGKWTATPFDATFPKLATVLMALWPSLMAISIFPLIFGEMSYAGMALAPKQEVGRVRDAMMSGVGLAFVCIFTFAAYYVASERNIRHDFAYFRTARPGTATLNIVAALDEKVQATLFFPPANEVGEQVRAYFEDLAKAGPQLAITYLDQAIDPVKAKELGVSANGSIVLSREQKKEQLNIALDMEAARRTLTTLDQEVQKRLIQVSRGKKMVYFTTGHGERGDSPADANDQRWTIRSLKDAFAAQNYQVKNLSAAEGLGREVPTDAAMVLIAGPQSPFMPEELLALSRYIDRGGRVFLALDPSAKLDFKELLEPLGVRYSSTVLANDEVFYSRTGNPSERVNIALSSFSSHPAVTTLGKLGARAPVLMIEAGSITEISPPPPGASVSFTVHSHPKTWNDENRNFEFDAATEKRAMYEVGVAITKTREGAKPTDEGRLLLLADSDAMGDPVLQNPGNAYLVIDGAKWLLGDEAIVGETNTEEDVRVEHTRKQDVAWFYLTIFAAPALIIAAGLFVTRNRKRASRPSKDSKAPEVTQS